MPAAGTIIERPRNVRNRVRSVWRPVAGPLVLLLIVIGFFWKILLTDQYSWIESPDNANQVVPWLSLQAQQFHNHRLPVWDPFLFGGQSLIGQGQPGVAYPLNWILFSLPLHEGHIDFNILNWYFVLIRYLASVFCYLLCRDLGRGRIASICAGVAFGIGGYVGSTDWPQMVNGAIWGPLVFLFLFRVARGRSPVRSAAFAGFFLGMSWLAGHHQIPIFLTLATLGAWLFIAFENGRLKTSLLLPATVFFAFFVCTGALQILPMSEYGRLAVRWSGSHHDPLAWNEPVPYTVHQNYALSPIHVLGIVIPGYTDNYSPYIGVAGLALAGLALACWWKTREVRIIFAVGIAGLLVALANNDVFHGMMYAMVPLFDKARSPSAAIYLTQFAAAVLAGFGIDTLRLPETGALLRRCALVLLCFGVVALLIVLGVYVGHNLSWSGDDRVVMSVIASLAMAALIYRASRGDTSPAVLSALVIALYMIEQGNVAGYAVPLRDDKDLSVYRTAFDSTKAVADFLKKQPQPVRADVSREAVSFNFGDWYEIDTMTGILPSLPASFANLDFVSSRIRNLYGSNYAVARKATDGEEEVFRDQSGLVVYKNPAALPRVWTVHEASRVANPHQALDLVQDDKFDPRKKTFSYDAPPRMEQCDGDAVRSFVRDTNYTSVMVDMKCRGIVVQSENTAPGWIAHVDGVRTPIYAAYTAMRGVAIGPGTHTIEMRYRPVSVIGGAMATFSAFIGALALCVVPRLRRRG